MKRSKAIVLASMAAVVAGCENPTPEPEKYDAYNSKQECIVDWQEEQACEKKYDNNTRSLVWVGPRYFGSAGIPYYTRPNGTRQYKNPSSSVISRPFVPITTPAISTQSRGVATSVPSVGSRGGFGGTAKSISVGSSGG